MKKAVGVRRSEGKSMQKISKNCLAMQFSQDEGIRELVAIKENSLCPKKNGVRSSLARQHFDRP